MTTQVPGVDELRDRPPLATGEGSALRRFLAALATPGGAVYILAAILLLAIIASNPGFGEPDRLVRSLARSAPLAILALGQYFVIVSGEFDLSMGSVIAAQVVMAGNLIGDDDSRILPVMALMLAVGVLVGLVNGVATTLLGVPSFIVTLGMMLALSGFVFYLTGGAATGNPSDNFREIGRGGIEGVPVVDLLPYPLLILIVLGAAATWLTRRPYGMTLIATGDNPGAASLGGASVWWVKTRAFVISSLSATVAGIVLVGQAGVHPSVGKGYEFMAITAVVLGGVVLGGGRGWVLSAAVGAIALDLLFTLLNFRDIPSTWRDTVQGVIIILAVALAGRAWRSGNRLPRALRRPGAAPDPSTRPQSS
ncbi:MAG TPA: ABC transporter permease [Nocardioidaceae bacterium]|nr:ABC transporter permease [Nocardioidaceae bacterium]